MRILILKSFAFGMGFFFACIMTLGIVSAATSGGLFGEILGKILGIPPAQVLTYTGDGTVANSAKLGGLPATSYQKVIPGESCDPGKCIYGYDADGKILCR